MPRQFLDEIVRPNVASMCEHFADLRHAFNAIASVDALAAHIYFWCEANRPTEIAQASTDSIYRGKLADRSPDFRLLRDIAKAQKHVELRQQKPLISRAGQVSAQSLGWDQLRWDDAKWDSPPQAVVMTDSGEFWTIRGIVERALIFLENEMVRLGI